MFNILVFGGGENEVSSLQSALEGDYGILYSKDFNSLTPLVFPDGKENPDLLLLFDPPLKEIRGFIDKKKISFTGIPSIIIAEEILRIPLFEAMDGEKSFFIEKAGFQDNLGPLITTLLTMQALKETEGESFPEEFRILAGKSPFIRKLKKTILKYASSDYPVLISGETGTGKEVVAVLLHRLSERKKGPFITKNCSAIPYSLIETELFGCERGAFTDAITRPGCFQCAEGGSLFLDEIGEMNLTGQVKLLRALELKEVMPIGSNRTYRIDLRVICATNKNLLLEIQKKKFRDDLYYRISTLKINLSPLRERKEDIPALVDYFLREEEGPYLTDSAMDKLMSFDWPGNVRELKSTIKRARVLSEGKIILPEDIDFDILDGPF